ncbi:putative transcription factor B3-Domain family [Helianthus anomalus]
MDWYTALEGGKIKCNGCGPQDSTLIPTSQETPRMSTRTPTHLAAGQQTLVASNQVTDERRSTPPPLALEPRRSKSSTKARAHVQACNDKPGTGTSRKNRLERYAPRMTVEELDNIFKRVNEMVTPLFEKALTPTDTGTGGRLVLPKICAEKFFPSIDVAESIPMVLQDSEGNDWLFTLRSWPNNKSQMYFLEGFEPYVQSMKLAQGDIVTFCRLEAQGTLVIGNRKVSSCTSQVSPHPRVTSSRKTEATTSASKRKDKMVMVSTAKEVAKANSCQIGSTSKSAEKQKKAHEDLPCGSNAPSDVVEKGFKRSSKGETRSATHSTVNKRKPNDSARVHETDLEPTNTLRVPTQWTKKHRSVRVCTGYKFASTSNNQSSSQAQVVSMPTETQRPNTDDQTTPSGGSEENRIVNGELGSNSKAPPFDLNKEPEPVGSNSKAPPFDLNKEPEPDSDEE